MAKAFSFEPKIETYRSRHGNVWEVTKGLGEILFCRLLNRSKKPFGWKKVSDWGFDFNDRSLFEFIESRVANVRLPKA